jgi:hypothetical protein
MIISDKIVMSTSTFEVCKQEGKYDLVTPGEVCTLEMAKKYGIADQNGNFVQGYTDVKTFRSEAETATRSLCLQTRDSTKAFQHCALEHGVGFVRKSTDPQKCVTVSCPPKWEERRGQCVKPLEDYILSKRAHCDERWYDWFTVPNYHLGNKMYEEKPGYCYKPCPAYHVPAFVSDPVDGESAGVSASDKQNSCANKNDYMGGKYAGTSDFCPLVWIKRMSSTHEILKSDLNTEFGKLVSKAGGQSQLNEHGQYLMGQVDAIADTVYKNINTSVENVNYDNNLKMISACRTLATPERLEQAYDVCKQLKEDPIGFEDRYKAMGENDALIGKKVAVLQQACNAVFCNELEDAAQVIGKDPICFDKPPRIDDQEIPKEEDPNDFDNQPPITSEPGRSKLGKAIRIGIHLVMTGVLIIFIILFIRWGRENIWPKIRCLLMKSLHFIGLRGRYDCEIHDAYRNELYQVAMIQKALKRIARQRPS